LVGNFDDASKKWGWRRTQELQRLIALSDSELSNNTWS
jgi:hypothetical protein